MKDFTLSITEKNTEFVISNSTGDQVAVPAFSLPTLSADKIGQWLYTKIFTGSILTSYQECVPDRLLLYLSPNLLDWPWRSLHDGFQFLALYHPILILSADNSSTSPITVEQEPLRILLTIAETRERAFSSDDEEKIISSFVEQHSQQVTLRIERGNLDTDRMLEVFRDAVDPFHIWHHTGFCEPELALRLADATLNVEQIQYLINQQQNLHCLVLNTHSSTLLDSALSRLNIPFIMRFTSSSTPQGTLPLIKGFYNRLLTHDLAVAGALTQLESYLANTQSTDWSSVGMFARTPNLYIASKRSERSSKETTPPTHTRILFLRANPIHKNQDLERLRIENEMREIKQATLENRRFFDLLEEGSVRTKDITGHLHRHQPHILHFSGHGSQANYLAFEKDDGETDRMPFELLANILALFKDTLRCVVLNACYTEPLAEVICQHIDCVIGMNDKISDSAATRFSRAFYEAISYGKSLGEAFKLACTVIGSTTHHDEANIPQIKSRADVDPNEIFFVSQARRLSNDE